MRSEKTPRALRRSVLVLCLAAFSLAWAQPSLFERGVQAFSQGDFQQAETLLKQAVQEQPHSFEIRFLLGATLVQLEKTDEAVKQLQQAHKLNPGHPDALKLLAAQHMTRRDFSSAIALLRPVLATSLADEEIYLLLIESLQTIGDTNTSFELSQKAVKLFPGSPQVNCWMGFQLQFSGRYEEAKTYLNQALRIAPDYPATYYLLADILLKEQDFKQAVPYFRKAVAAKPDDVDARIGLGQALTGLERLEEALKELQQAAQIAPEEARVHFQLSRLYFRLGDEKRAEQEAELSVKLRPPEPLIVEVPSALRGGTAP